MVWYRNCYGHREKFEVGTWEKILLLNVEGSGSYEQCPHLLFGSSILGARRKPWWRNLRYVHGQKRSFPAVSLKTRKLTEIVMLLSKSMRH